MQSCLHKVINFLQLPEPYQNVPYLYLCHQPVLNSATLCKNVEIPRKRAKSMSRQKVPPSTENWFLLIASRVSAPAGLKSVLEHIFCIILWYFIRAHCHDLLLIGIYQEWQFVWVWVAACSMVTCLRGYKLWQQFHTIWGINIFSVSACLQVSLSHLFVYANT